MMKTKYLKHTYKIISVILLVLIHNGIMAQNITDCYSRSTVIGEQSTAGFAAHLSEGADVRNVYSTGLVITDDRETAGGLIASADANVNIRNSYWDRETAGISQSEGGFARTTEKMSYPHTDNTYFGWNFMSIWQQDVNKQNHGYPFLLGKTPTLYALSLSSNNANYGSVLGDNSYSNGATVFVEAQPEPGFELVGWNNEAGQQQSTEAVYDFYMPASDHSLQAIFDFIDYFVTVDITPVNAGTVTGAGTYHIEDDLTLVAEAHTGFRFLNWTDDNGHILSEELELDLTVETEDIHVTANFEATTSTEESLVNVIDIYPNPFSGFLNITNVESPTSLQVFDYTGKLMFSSIINGDMMIETQTWPQGNYLIQLTDMDNNAVSLKRIKLDRN